MTKGSTDFEPVFDDLEPDRIAAMLGLSRTGLARLVGVSPITLIRPPLGRVGRFRLEPLLNILSEASAILGSPRDAVIWFRYAPILALGSRTAMDHVADSNAESVLRHLSDVRGAGST